MLQLAWPGSCIHVGQEYGRSGLQMEMEELFQKEEWTLGRQKQSVSSTAAIVLLLLLQFTIIYY